MPHCLSQTNRGKNVQSIAARTISILKPARGKYSTVLLSEGETAEVNGAGQHSLFLLIHGPRGNWIIFDSISEPADADSAGMLVLTGPDKTVYRRSHEPRVYAIQPSQPDLVDGEMVKIGVMGVDAMLKPLDNPAIVGNNSDFDVIERVLPGVIDRCDLRFVAGQGLVSSASRSVAR
jgi:hypothetical protein